MGLGDEYREEQQAEIAQAARQRRRADQSRKRGSGTTTWSARSAARSSIPGGRPKPAAFSSRRCPAPPSSSPARRRCRSSACSRRWSTPRATSLEGEATGNLVILDAWPGMMRTVYGDHKRFVDTYFSAYKGKYFTGDGCRRDEDGYYWITGRVDDVINVAGHRMGTAEVESALVAHPKVSEAAVVGYPHDIKGQGIYCYVTLMVGPGVVGRAQDRAAQLGAQGDRADRLARSHSVRARPARRRARARSCAASCARSPRTISAISAIHRRLPIPAWSTDLIEHRQNRKSV